MPFTRTTNTHTITATGQTANVEMPIGVSVFQFKLTGTSASVVLQVSNNNSDWFDAATVSLTTGAPTDFVVNTNSWNWYRFNTTAISGTNVVVQLSGG